MVGYSLNDTIIIFDRVRENLKKHKSESFEQILNRSINETLPRSVLTHGTTLSSLLALAVFGGEVIRPFALVMFFGVFTGTFSSIYIASPVLMAIEKRWPGQLAKGHLTCRRSAGAGPGRQPEDGTGRVVRHRAGACRPDSFPCSSTPTATSPIRRTTRTGSRCWRARGPRGWCAWWSSANRGAAAERALALASAEPRLSVTAGVHPHDASGWSQDGPRLAPEHACADSEVVAAGEMGLDYHYDHSPRDAQRAAFEAQLVLAREAGKAAVIHAREADDGRRGDASEPSGRAGDPAFVQQRARRSCGRASTSATMCRSAGWSPSRTGVWTRPSCETPLDRLLVETDGPYLAPVPHRGKRNEPAYVRQVAERIAAVRGLPAEELIAATAANAARVFRFRDPLAAEPRR